MLQSPCYCRFLWGRFHIHNWLDLGRYYSSLYHILKMKINNVLNKYSDHFLACREWGSCLQLIVESDIPFISLFPCSNCNVQ